MTSQTQPTPIEIATRFAQALDHEDYPAAIELLSDTCVYHIRGKTHQGPEAIIASYQSNGDQATQNFDSITYGSSVRPSDDNRIIIEFWDQITHRGRIHKHQCEQWLRVKDGFITEIEHKDLLGEVEGLNAFKAWCAESD
jgi:limonene-1,2-epoxide hydrolase